MKKAFEGTGAEDNGMYDRMYDVPPMFTCLGSPPRAGIPLLFLDEGYVNPSTRGTEGAI